MELEKSYLCDIKDQGGPVNKGLGDKRRYAQYLTSLFPLLTDLMFWRALNLMIGIALSTCVVMKGMRNAMSFFWGGGSVLGVIV